MKRFWRMTFWLILLSSIYLFLPASEIATARQWVERFLGWWR